LVILLPGSLLDNLGLGGVAPAAATAIGRRARGNRFGFTRSLRPPPQGVGRTLRAALTGLDGACRLPGDLLVVDPQRFHQGSEFAGGQIPPFPNPQVAEGNRTDARPPQALNLNAGNIHDPPNEVIDPFVHADCQNRAIGRLPEQPDFLRNDSALLDHDTVADALQLALCRPRAREDVIFLGQLVPRMHDPMRDIAIVGQQEQALGVAVKPSDWKNPFADPNKVHHRPAIALVACGSDVPGRFVEHQIAQWWLANDLVVDPDFIGGGISARAQLGHDLAVDRDAAFGDQCFGGASGGNAASGEYALESFQIGLREWEFTGRRVRARQFDPNRRRIARAPHRSWPVRPVSAPGGS
jgi:hypothetical protein